MASEIPHTLHVETWPAERSPARSMTFRGEVLVQERGEARFLFDDAIQPVVEGLIAGRNEVSLDRLPEVLGELNGSFSCAVTENAEGATPRLLLFTDRFAAHPIYYVETFRAGEPVLVYGEDALSVAREVAAPLSPANALAIASFEFIPGERTAATGVRQLLAGDAMLVTQGRSCLDTRIIPYWRPRVAPSSAGSPEELETRLAELLRAVASDWEDAVVRLCAGEGRAAIPLSGGLDSRLLLGLLAPESEGRIVAACYGAPGSQDVDLSRRAAKAIGVDHRFVPFLGSDVLSPDRRVALARRIGLTTRLTLADGGMALAQAFGARASKGTRDVEYFLPGHSGDGISGSKLKEGSAKHADPEALASHLVHTYRRTFPADVLRELLRPEWRELAGEPELLMRVSCAEQDGRDGFERTQRWTMRELVRRRVLTELPVYRDVARPMLPFFDKRLADFFSELPASELIGQRLYNRVALNQIFRGAQEKLGHIPFQGRSRAEMLGKWSGAAKLARRVHYRVLREIGVEALDRRLTACPMVSLWRHDAAFRESVMHDLRTAEILPTIFDQEKLMGWLGPRLGEDDAITTTGVWGLLTIEYVGRALG